MEKISPEAKVIAAFTLITSIVFGSWNGIAVLVARILSDLGDRGLVAGTTVAAVALGAMLLARNGSSESGAAWAKQLAGATAILAVLVIVASAAFVIGNISHANAGFLGY